MGLGLKRDKPTELELRRAALEDGFTGSVPNDTWGAGKLRLWDAYVEASKPSLLREPDGSSDLFRLPPESSVPAKSSRLGNAPAATATEVLMGCSSLPMETSMCPGRRALR